jgi:hypothetical protein
MNRCSALHDRFPTSPHRRNAPKSPPRIQTRGTPRLRSATPSPTRAALIPLGPDQSGPMIPPLLMYNLKRSDASRELFIRALDVLPIVFDQCPVVWVHWDCMGTSYTCIRIQGGIPRPCPFDSWAYAHRDTFDIQVRFEFCETVAGTFIGYGNYPVPNRLNCNDAATCIIDHITGRNKQAPRKYAPGYPAPVLFR